VSPAGVATSYYFEWGTTTAYGNRLPSTGASLASSSQTTEVADRVTNLQPSAVYHYRIVASDCGGCASGTSAGADATFTTSSVAPVTKTEPVMKTELTTSIAEAALLSVGKTPVASPVIGRQARVEIASGTILVRLAHNRSFAALSGATGVPIGSVIDATRGVLRLTTAINSAGATQSATIWGGVFQVMQTSAGHGMTNLILTGAPLKCSPRLKAHASSARSSRPKSRSIWAEDRHGRYSTHGANSVATVLGTRWETVDTCAGTLTRVVRGRVRVRSLHGRSSVIVAAGHSFLARP
jgi:hypothetical protein